MYEQFGARVILGIRPQGCHKGGQHPGQSDRSLLVRQVPACRQVDAPGLSVWWKELACRGTERGGGHKRVCFARSQADGAVGAGSGAEPDSVGGVHVQRHAASCHERGIPAVQPKGGSIELHNFSAQVRPRVRPRPGVGHMSRLGAKLPGQDSPAEPASCQGMCIERAWAATEIGGKKEHAPYPGRTGREQAAPTLHRRGADRFCCC